MSVDLNFGSVVVVARKECRVQISFSSVLPFFNLLNDFFSVTVKSDFLRAPGIFYSFIRVSLTGAPLVTNQILSLTLHWQTANDFTVSTIICPGSPFGRSVPELLTCT